jgi:Flp pilus assembly protein TadG
MMRWISALVRSRMVRGRRGTVAAMVGLTAIPIVLTAGLGIDGTRLWLLKTQLQAAVDASVLLAASPSEASVGTATATADASNLFWADFGRVSRTGNSSSGFINTGFMGATISDTALSVAFPDVNHVQITATATLPMTFMTLAGVSTSSVSASATAERAGGVEMTLVLDISLSMEFPMGDGTSNNKEQALQAAAASMLSALYGSNDTVPNLFLSIVPFAGAVDIGNSHTNWLDSSFSNANPANGAVTYKGSTANGSGWRGCVEARQGGRDLTEDSPATAPFAPFYWPSTLNQYPNGTNPPYKGDNEWSITNISDNNSFNQSQTGSNIPHGPNLGCPHNAVLPLTASKTTVSNAITSFTLTNPVGTVVVQGLQWGWFTLSPSWQGSSGWNLQTPGGALLPLNYAAPNNRKVIVLMTDGTTDVSGAQTFYGAANAGQSLSPACDAAIIAPDCITSSGGTNTLKSVNWARTDADSWYSPYGRVSAGRVLPFPPAPPNPPSPAVHSETATEQFSAALDGKVSTLCNSIKQQGIIIFTIFFHGPEDDYYDAHLGSEAGTASASSILQGCATDSNHFFDATSSATINSAFVTIANQIAALRLTH